MKMFNYQATLEFLSDYWWSNPQDIADYEQKYNELAASNSRLSIDPREAFSDDVNFFAFSSLFGEDFFTYEEASEYCSKEYLKLQNHVDLQQLLKILRTKEPRLPSNPAYTYKEKWKTWGNFFKTVQLVKESPFYTLAELRAICIEHLSSAAVKPINLQKFYQSFKHNASKMPKNPYMFYKKTGEWESWNDLFGLETANWAGYSRARSFCIKRCLEDLVKPTRLADFYLQLRECHKEEISLPRHPDEFYAKTNEWQSYKNLFGLN